MFPLCGLGLQFRGHAVSSLDAASGKFPDDYSHGFVGLYAHDLHATDVLIIAVHFEEVAHLHAILPAERNFDGVIHHSGDNAVDCGQLITRQAVD